MTVKLPRGLVFDLNDIPEDFEQRISDCFRDYTSGTNPEYMFHDKLAFIDLCVENMRRKCDTETEVRQLMHDYMDDTIDNYGNIPDESDYLCVEFMEWCYDAGKESASLYGKYTEKGSKTDNKLMQLLCRIIKVVICYGDKREEE